MRIDLHTHSSRSDGTDTPSQLMAMAAGELDVIALTDHDTVDGWAEAADTLPAGLTLVAGAEISSADDDRTVHLLAYLFDPDEPTFAGERRRLTEDRVRRAQVMVAKLRELGVDVTWDRVAELAGGGTVGRPHVARALVERGVVVDVPSAFTPMWLARGGRAYAEKYVLDPTDAIDLVRTAGGVTVLAHPGRSLGEDRSFLERLATAGLHGVEVDHPDHERDLRDRLRSVAGDLGLVATGSSDYHGAIKATPLGACTTAQAQYEALVGQATGRQPIHA